MIISNSEVDTYLSCQRMHYYRYALGLEPRKVSQAMRTGLLGHHVLEQYYTALRDGLPRGEAVQAGMDAVLEAYDYEDPEIVNVINHKYAHYTRFWDDDDFRIIDVEQVFLVPLNERITYGMTIDLLVEYTKGTHKGQLAVIDHKFKYNFPSNDALSMHVQLFKYMWGLQQNGFPVTIAKMNIIRYREDIVDPNKMFKRVQLVPTGEQIENIMAEHLYVSEEIYNAKNQPVSWYASHAPRRLSERICEGCYFRIPCRLSLLGKDESKTLASMYKPAGVDEEGPYRSYGYRDESISLP